MTMNICHNCLKSFKGEPAEEVPKNNAYSRKYCPTCVEILRPNDPKRIRCAGLSHK